MHFLDISDSANFLPVTVSLRDTKGQVIASLSRRLT